MLCRDVNARSYCLLLKEHKRTFHLKMRFCSTKKGELINLHCLDLSLHLNETLCLNVYLPLRHEICFIVSFSTVTSKNSFLT